MKNVTSPESLKNCMTKEISGNINHRKSENSDISDIKTEFII